MAKLKPQFPIASMSGKVAKTDEIYTKTRQIDQVTIAVALKHPVSNEPPTPKQSRAQTDLKTAYEAVKTIMQDPAQKATYKKAWKKDNEGYVTLRGYIFSKKYVQTPDSQD